MAFLARRPTPEDIGAFRPSEASVARGRELLHKNGHPVRHSASPAMHNAALSVLGLNWRYLAFDVHPNQLAPAMTTVIQDGP